MTGNDVASILGAVNKNDDGFFSEGLWGVILLLIVAGVIGGSGFFGGNGAVAAGLTRAEMDSEFNQRDIFNTNSNVLENRYANAVAEGQTQRDILENRYTSQLGVQSILSNQAECCCNNRMATMQSTYDLSQLADRNNFNTLLGNKDLTAAITADGEKTRALITANYQANLLEQINDLKSQISDQNTVSSILNATGRWHGYPSCSCGYGTCSSSNLI